MLNSLWSALIGVDPILLYLIIFILVFGECSAFFGLIIPGETAIILGGFLAFTGKLNLTTLMVIAVLGAVLGDTTGYWFGHWKGKGWALRFGRRFGVTPGGFKRVEDFFHRHGGKAVFLGRFTSFARAFVPFTAGTLQLRYTTFLIYNVLGGLVWAIGFSYLGYIFGNQWEKLVQYAGRGGLILLGIALIVGWILWRRHEENSSK